MTITVQRVAASDVAELVEFWDEDAAALEPHFVMPHDNAQWEGALTDSSTRWYCVRCEGEVLAAAVLARVTDEPWCSAEVGVGVGRAARGHGVGTSTLRAIFKAELGAMLARIEALVDPSNTSSMSMVASAGMEFEGVSRSAIHIGDHRADLARWAITADHFEKLTLKDRL